MQQNSNLWKWKAAVFIREAPVHQKGRTNRSAHVLRKAADGRPGL